jgi:photosystem II stability/assembly factor-like uncharacterized protein
MRHGLRRSTLVICGLLLFCSLGLGEWVKLNSGTTAELYSVHFPEGTQVGYAAGAGQDSLGGFVGVILKTTDRGDTWQTQNVGHVNVLNSVYFTTDDTGYAVGQRGAALRTTDGGANWIPMTVPGSDNLTRVQFPEDGLVGYIGVHPAVGGKVLKTTDGGGAWTSINVGGPFDTSYSCGMAADTIGVVVGYHGMVYGTAGDSAQDPQTNADIVAAAFSPADPNEGYLIGNDSATGLGVIRYTHDGGVTPWDSVRCHPITAFYGVTMADSLTAYVCGAGGRIDRSVMSTDFYRTLTWDYADMYGVCFPHGADTGYAVGATGTILRTYDGGIPMMHALSEGKGPAMSRAGIRVLSNPSRHGITFHAGADVNVAVFDAAGRVVARQAATKGVNFLPLSKANVYYVREAQAQAQAQAIRVVLTE